MTVPAWLTSSDVQPLYWPVNVAMVVDVHVTPPLLVRQTMTCRSGPTVTDVAT